MLRRTCLQKAAPRRHRGRHRPCPPAGQGRQPGEIQVFEGTVIAKKHGGINETFTVRRISYGVGVEKVFPVHSPAIEKIKLVRHGKIRRAKLYYLRGRVGKAAKIKEAL